MGHDLLVAELRKGGADHQRRSAANHAPSALAYKKGSTPSDVAKRQQAKSVRLAWRTLALLELAVGSRSYGFLALMKELEWTLGVRLMIPREEAAPRAWAGGRRTPAGLC